MGSTFRAGDADDLVRIRKTSGVQFRMNLLAVDRHLKRAAFRRHQRQGLDVLLQLEELVRQTDGMRLVVSSRAVFDGDLQWHVVRTLKRSKLSKTSGLSPWPSNVR